MSGSTFGVMSYAGVTFYRLLSFVRMSPENDMEWGSERDSHVFCVSYDTQNIDL